MIRGLVEAFALVLRVCEFFYWWPVTSDFLMNCQNRLTHGGGRSGIQSLDLLHSIGKTTTHTVGMKREILRHPLVRSNYSCPVTGSILLSIKMSPQRSGGARTSLLKLVIIVLLIFHDHSLCFINGGDAVFIVNFNWIRFLLVPFARLAKLLTGWARLLNGTELKDVSQGWRYLLANFILFLALLRLQSIRVYSNRVAVSLWCVC